MEFEHAERLLDHLAEIVDHPLAHGSPRMTLSATLAVSSLQQAAATRVLCESGLALGAATTLRSQFEALVRSVWVLNCALESQVERLCGELSVEAQQASKSMPTAQVMLTSLEQVPQLAKLMVSLKEFKDSSWMPLNSFVHSDIHAVHWTRNDAPPQLLEQIFRASNGLAVIAYQGLGILTGRVGIQAELIAATAAFSSCLPPPR